MPTALPKAEVSLLRRAVEALTADPLAWQDRRVSARKVRQRLAAADEPFPNEGVDKYNRRKPSASFTEYCRLPGRLCI